MTDQLKASRLLSVLLHPAGSKGVYVILPSYAARYSGLTTGAHCDQDGTQKAPQLNNDGFCIFIRGDTNCTVML